MFSQWNTNFCNWTRTDSYFILKIINNRFCSILCHRRLDTNSLTMNKMYLHVHVQCSCCAATAFRFRRFFLFNLFFECIEFHNRVTEQKLQIPYHIRPLFVIFAMKIRIVTKKKKKKNRFHSENEFNNKICQVFKL